MEKHISAIQRLIDMGADINIPDDNMNKLPLHWAINNKLSSENKKSIPAVEAVKCLLDNGARMDIICYDDKTPLEYAKSRGFKAAANLLSETFFRNQQEVFVLGLFGSGKFSLKEFSDNSIVDRNAVKMISDFLRPANVPPPAPKKATATAPMIAEEESSNFFLPSAPGGPAPF